MLLTKIGWGVGDIHSMTIFLELLNIFHENDFINKVFKIIFVPSSYFPLLSQFHYPSLLNDIQVWDIIFIHMKSFIYGHIPPCRWIKITLNFKFQIQSFKLKLHFHAQAILHMFTIYICPTATQRRCQHYDKVNIWKSREISNNDIISFVIIKNIVNSSIPKWRDINSGENNALEK
jgi:hypothetical protein